MNYPKATPPTDPEQLRADLDSMMTEIIAERGPRHPLAAVLSQALLAGTDKALRAAWSFYRSRSERDST